MQTPALTAKVQEAITFRHTARSLRERAQRSIEEALTYEDEAQKIAKALSPGEAAVLEKHAPQPAQ